MPKNQNVLYTIRMNLNIKTTNFSLTPAIKAYLEKKLMVLDKLVDFDRENVLIRAELGKTSQHHRHGDIFRAEADIKIGGTSFRAVSEKEDLYAAIDDLKDELTREITTWKDKKKSKVRRGAQSMKKILRKDSGNESE